MAFIPSKHLNGINIPFEFYLMTDAEAVTLGEALVQTSGRLTKCAATTKPQFIAMKTQDAEATAVTPIPVVRVQDDLEFAATSTATVAATVIGSAVTLHTDGLSPTATASSGVFTISATDGATTNSKVRGYFRD
jgi:hypothetical protein